jgi:alpha-tubulin suppressor-like RCC1 family protein
LLENGGVKCWGANFFGQLGDGSTADRHTPVNVKNLSGVKAVAAGSSHTCAVTSGGGVKCWGYNGWGQLGDGTTADRYTPFPVSNLDSGVKALAAGFSHTCALTTAGGVKCWGRNNSGQLGDNATTDRHEPTLALHEDIRAITAGDEHTCALTVGGGVLCWGGNSHGQLGDHTHTDRHMATNVLGLSSGVAAASAGSSHT